MVNEKEIIKATNELSKIVRKNLYGSESKRQIRSFLNLFPKLESIINKKNLNQLECIKNYNENLFDMYNLTPNTILNVWEVYRRNLFTATFVIDTLETSNLSKSELDKYLAKTYVDQNEELGKATFRDWISEEKGGVYGPEHKLEYYSVEEDSPLELIDIRKNELVPINNYIFENKLTRKKIVSHYDLSSTKIPYLSEFLKGDMSFETRSYFNSLKNCEHLDKNYLESYYQELK